MAEELFKWIPVKDAKLKFKYKNSLTHTTDDMLVSGKFGVTIAYALKAHVNHFRNGHTEFNKDDVFFSSIRDVLLTDVEAVADMPAKYVMAKKENAIPKV